MNPIDWQQFSDIRKTLHQHPELSGEEQDTAKRIVQYLERWQPTTVYQQVGGTGVVAQFGPRSEKAILVRCELDALPIQEQNDFAHQSNNQGVSHKCGHDGHMAILLALAQLLNQHPIHDKTVYLLFQPAEETGEGAKAVLDDQRMQTLPIKQVISLHNVPGYPLGSIVCKTGAFSAAVESMIIQLQGKTAHAGEPENGINPALAVAEITTQFHQLQFEDGENFQLVTPIYTHLGEKEAFGVSAGEAVIHVTCRSFSPDQLTQLKNEMENIVNSVSSKHELSATIEWTQAFDANQNHPDVVTTIQQAAKSLGYQYIQKESPFRWGEDFGVFTQRYPGAMFGLGAGENSPELHHPDYDFPDALIEKGARMFYEIIKNSHF